MKKITLLLALMLMLTACSNLTATNLMAGIKRNDTASIVIDGLHENSVDKVTEIAGFSLDIFKKYTEMKIHSFHLFLLYPPWP